MDQSHTQTRDWLLAATVVFLVANLLHTADHMRQGIDGVRETVIAAGTILTVMAVLGVWLAARGHRHAALFAELMGFQAFVGVGVAHIAPDWGFLSDSYPHIHADALSWAVMLLEMAAALGLGLVARGVRRASGPAPARLQEA